jgi:hypothetical protein
MKMARRDFWSMATIGFRGFEYEVRPVDRQAGIVTG